MSLKDALAPSIEPVLRDYIQAVADEALARGAQQLAIDRADIEELKTQLRDKLDALNARLTANGLKL